jgi:hypothetical protein
MKTTNNRLSIALAAVLALGTSVSAYAQSSENTLLDTKVIEADKVTVTDKVTNKSKTINISWPNDPQLDMIDWTINSPHWEDHDPKKRSSGRPILGITFSRIDLGYAKIMDNGSFTLSTEQQDLKTRPGKTLNFGFDVLQAGYRFNRNFRMYASGGFDWTYYRFRNNINFKENTTPLDWAIADPADGNYSKNRLTSTYLRIPLALEVRGKHKSFLSVGPEWSFLLKGTQRYKVNGEKIKTKDDYNFSQMRFGFFARAGVKDFGVFAKYYVTDIFENSPAQKDLNNFSFGITFNM